MDKQISPQQLTELSETVYGEGIRLLESRIKLKDVKNIEKYLKVYFGSIVISIQK
jgi:hypothetical protein